MTRVLVVEDDPATAAFLTDNLAAVQMPNRAGFVPYWPAPPR